MAEAMGNRAAYAKHQGRFADVHSLHKTEKTPFDSSSDSLKIKSCVLPYKNNGAERCTRENLRIRVHWDIYRPSDPQLLIYLTSFSTNIASNF